ALHLQTRTDPLQKAGRRACGMTTDESTLDALFADFHQANPHVYAERVRLARQMRDRGHSKLGIGMLGEVLGWRSMLRTKNNGFRLNNNFRSRYARLVMQQESDLAEIFDTRGLASERVAA